MGLTGPECSGTMSCMKDGQLVRLDDDAVAQVKQVLVSAWQTVLVAVELPVAPQPVPASAR
ncbi:MAG: hypothetical protein AB1938_28500 [Myxococcota bacterium]